MNETADIDAVFEALADEYGRYVLRYLTEHDTVTFDELCDAVTGWKHAVDGVADWDDRRHTAIRLHHATLPKLDRMGFVVYDVDERLVISRVDDRLLDDSTLVERLQTAYE